MQDRISQIRRNLLHRTAGPYVGVKAEVHKPAPVITQCACPKTHLLPAAKVFTIRHGDENKRNSVQVSAGMAKPASARPLCQH